MKTISIHPRLDELRALEDGWLEGHGVAPPASGLDWFAEAFERGYDDDLPVPYLYPTESGGIQLEWGIPPFEASLEVDLGKRWGEWHCLNLKTDVDELLELDLSGATGWGRLAIALRRLAGDCG
jgi:hypothetical protein